MYAQILVDLVVSEIVGLAKDDNIPIRLNF